jgi:hypothetical protein
LKSTFVFSLFFERSSLSAFSRFAGKFCFCCHFLSYTILLYASSPLISLMIWWWLERQGKETGKGENNIGRVFREWRRTQWTK